MSKLRKNSVLLWSENARRYIQETIDLTKISLNDELKLDNGHIPYINTTDDRKYFSHIYRPLVENNVNVVEFGSFLRCKHIIFENKYGKIRFTDDQFNKLNKIVYKFNQYNIKNKENYSEAFENTAIVLHYFTVNVKFEYGSKANAIEITFGNGEIKKFDTDLNEQDVKLIIFFKQHMFNIEDAGASLFL